MAKRRPKFDPSKGKLIVVHDKALRSLTTSLQKNMVEAEKNIYLHVSRSAHIVRDLLRKAAPYDKGRYSHGWRVQDTNKQIAQFSVYNQVGYGVYIEEGVIPGNAPWPQMGPKTVELTTPGSGGAEKRIWSRSAPGGTVNQIITDVYANRLAKTVGNIIMDGLQRAK